MDVSTTEEQKIVDNVDKSVDNYKIEGFWPLRLWINIVDNVDNISLKPPEDKNSPVELCNLYKMYKICHDCLKNCRRRREAGKTVEETGSW